jgi:hypothetical protein
MSKVRPSRKCQFRSGCVPGLLYARLPSKAFRFACHRWPTQLWRTPLYRVPRARLIRARPLPKMLHAALSPPSSDALYVCKLWRLVSVATTRRSLLLAVLPTGRASRSVCIGDVPARLAKKSAAEAAPRFTSVVDVMRPRRGQKKRPTFPPAEGVNWRGERYAAWLWIVKTQGREQAKN